MWLHDLIQTISSGLDVSLIIIIILLAILVQIVSNRLKRILDDIATSKKLLEVLRQSIATNHEALQDHTEKTAYNTSKKFWKECQEMRCPKTDILIQKFEDQNRCLHSFVEDGKQARRRTQETLDRMEQTLTSFVTDLGRALIRRFREGREDI